MQGAPALTPDGAPGAFDLEVAAPPGPKIQRMDAKLLALLVCPVTKVPLDFNPERQELLSRSARLAYPVRDGIPIMLEVQARTLSDEELDALPPRTPLV